jgi:hypothetical protein
MVSAIPPLAVEVAFNGGPFSSSYNWTDITPYVEGFQINRGRSTELDTFEAGTLSLSLDNSDGRFTPGKQTSGANVLTSFSGQYDWDVTGRANNTIISTINMGSIDDDGQPRVIKRTVWTNGLSASCYFSVKWLDAGGATLKWVIGTRFVADAYATVYTHEEAPPAGTATAVLYIYADTYPDGNSGLIISGSNAEWYKTQPYYPNVLPRRRVRIRGTNEIPRDVSTGGDISASSSLFSVSHSAGASKQYITSVAKSGTGSVRVDYGNNGTSDFANSVYCGYSSGGAPIGLTHVEGGKAYSIGVGVRQGLLSADVNVKTRIRWYDSNLSFISSSAGGPSTVMKGTRYNWALNPNVEVDLTNTNTVGTGITRNRVITEKFSGTASIEHAVTAASSQAGSSWNIEPITGTGTVVRFRVAVKVPASGLSNFTFVFQNGSTTVASVPTGMPDPSTWTLMEGSYTLTAGQTIDRVGFTMLGATTGTKFWGDTAMVQASTPTGYLATFADGSTSGYHWAGVANASATVSDSWSPQWTQASVLNQTAPANAVWAGVEVGTSGATATSYVLLDELQLQQGSALTDWTPGGSIFHGYIEKWPVKADAYMASVDVTAVDGFSILGSTELASAVQAQTLATNPLGYWPLGDAVGSARLENKANDTQPAKFAASKYGGGTPLLGATSILAKDPATCWSLANVGTNIGTVVDICEGGTRNYVLGTDFTVNFWTYPTRPSSGQYVTLFAGWSDTGADFLTVRMDSTGIVTATATYTDGTVQVATATTALNSAYVSMVSVVIASGVLKLYLNGSLHKTVSSPVPGSAFDIRDLRWASFGGRQAGSVYAEYSNGRHGHLAIWDRAVSSTDLSDIWRLGDNGGAIFSENENARLARILNMAEFSGALSLDGGVSTLQDCSWSAGDGALGELQQAASDASGYVFMDGDGEFTYHNRQRRQSANVRYVLGDSTGLPYEPGLEFVMDEDKIVNEVNYQRTGGTSGTLKDQPSIDLYGRRSKSLELSITSDSEVQDASYTLLNLYADPIVRCDTVTLKATATPNLFGVVLGVEIGDRITLTDLPAQAPSSSMDFFIESIDTTVTAQGGTPEWVTTLALSPASGYDVWLLEDPVLGRLDRTAVLAY